MATFKTVIESHYRKSDGTYNIKIRVTHNREKKLIKTQWHLYENELTKSLKIKNQFYIDACEDLIRLYRKRLDECGVFAELLSIDDVVDIVTKGDSGFKGIDFVAFSRDYAGKMITNGRTGSGKNYLLAINSFVKYCKSEQVDIMSISTKVLNGYMEYLSGDNPTSRKVSLYMNALKSLYSWAKDEYNDEDRNIIRIPYSPFSKIKIPRQPETKKRAIDIEVIRRIKEFPYSDEPSKHTRRDFAKDVFLLSFYLIGMNSVDLFRCTNLSYGRITYNRSKTTDRRMDNAEISIKIESEALVLINKYKDPDKKRIFNFYKKHSTPSTFNAAVNIGLKQLGGELGIPNLDFYAARHSWATIARNKCGVSRDDVDLALNHVGLTSRVADIYIAKDWSLIDRANRKVLDLLSGCEQTTL